MSFMILGQGGVVGHATEIALRAAGHRVLSVSRSADGPDTARADRERPEQILALVRAHRIETVIDVLAYTEPDTLALLAALDRQIERYVLLSSADVYRNYGLLHERETGPIDPILTETSALRDSRYPYRGPTPRAVNDPMRWMDQYDKIPLEERVQSLKSDWTVLRLPMLYGPGDKQHRFRWLVGALQASRETVTFPEAWLDWTTSYGFSSNIGATIAAAAAHPDAENQIFNIIDEEAVPHRAWIARFADLIGWSGEIKSTTEKTHPLALATASLNLDVPLALSGTKLTDHLGFEAPFPLAERLEETLKWERT